MPITLILIAVTAVVSFVAFSNALLMEKLIFSPTEITQKNQYYRFITSGFLHADVGHLLINMFVFWSFGTYVEGYLDTNTQNGTFWYLLLYLGGIAVSSVPTYLQQKNNYNYRSLGASGAVEAVVFASILISPMTNICLYGILCLPAVLMGLAFLGYEYYMNTRRTDNINHSAHFTGAIFGFAYLACLLPSLLPNFVAQIVAYF
jgi:membrane associated rhomboid family serine protease